MKNMVMWIVGGLLVAFFVAGCVSSGLMKDTAHRMVIQNRVLAYIDGDPAVAEEFVRVGTLIRAEIGKNRAARARDLEALAEAAIPWEKLNPVEERDLRALMSDIQTALDRYAKEDGRLSPEQKLHLQEVMTWIIEAAGIVP